MALRIGLIVPVLHNFAGFAELIASVDQPVHPIIIPNWHENVGVSKGWNVGIERAIEARCDLALICNDDVVLHSGTIYKLRTSVWDLGYDLVSGCTRPQPDNSTHQPTPDFSCFMIKPEEFTEEFGWFDENFSPAYFEDNDMAYRIQLEGGTAVMRPDAGHTHRGSVTQNWAGRQVVNSRMFESNRAYYSLKWGGWPGKETLMRPFGRDDVGVDFW